MLAQEPDDVLHQLVVHAGRAELGQVEDDAEIIDDLFETLATSLLQAIYYELCQFVDVALGSVVIFSWNVDDGTPEAVSVSQDTCLIRVVLDSRSTG